MLSINGAMPRGQVAFGGYFKNNIKVSRQLHRRDEQQIPVGHG
jgi:hypothetical protein